MKTSVRRAVCGVALAFFSAAQAAPVSITVTDDRTAEDFAGDGVAESLGPTNDYFLRVFGGMGTYRGVLEFDISSLGAGSVVNSLSLRLSDRGGTIPATMQVWGFAGDGAVSVADGNTLTTLLGTFNVVAGDLDYVITLDTAYVQSLVGSGADWLGLVVGTAVATPDIFRGADFCSREALNGTSNFPGVTLCNNGSAPTLNLDVSAAAVPTPGTLALAGLALLALRATRRGAAARAAGQIREG